MNAQHPTLTQTTSILIDGATGYIGSHLVHALTETGNDKINVRCLVRKNADVSEVNLLETSGAQIFRADLTDNNLASIFSQVDTACHLIGSIAPRKGETSASLHIGQTERFVQQCLNAGVKKIIMISACGAAPQAQSDYHRTKWQAERLVLESGIPSFILRPSLVIGKTSGNRNSKLITRIEYLIRNKKLVPLIAGGKNKVQPIFIQDLIEAILASFDLTDGSAKENSIIELGGPEIITLRELVQRMMAKIGIERSILALPLPVASLAAHVAQLTQEVPIISQDQIKIARQDNVCHDNRLESLIKRKSTTINNALDSYGWEKTKR
jgi:uncharacterized protein YbjT (DUF2867 family)